MKTISSFSMHTHYFPFIIFFNFLHTSWQLFANSPHTALKRYPEKNSPEKIPLNTVEREPVPTRVLNPNASEASKLQAETT